MKFYLLIIFNISIAFCLWACQTDNSPSSPQKPCVHPSFGDYINFDLEYRSPDDSVLFSTFKKQSLEIRFQESFFKGLLNEELQRMCPGDSNTFFVDAKTLLGENNPLTKKAAQINLILKLYDVKTEEAYKATRMTERNQQMVTDDSLITNYMAQKNMELKKSRSGVYYIIKEQGEGNPPTLKNKVHIDYNIKLLGEDVSLEFSENGGKEINLNRLPKGMREIIMLLGKGGKAQAIIPSSLAYQNHQRGRIPANSVLKYEVELLDFEESK
ncbi:MAG: FKBP-type peptidyl-prolyl cis-trans isomerase [Chitinophagales bacterium]